MTAEGKQSSAEAARQAVYDADFQRQVAVQLRDRPAADLEAALDTFEDRIREQERQRYRELVSAAREASEAAEAVAAHIEDIGGSGGNTVRSIADTLDAALAALPEEGRS